MASQTAEIASQKPVWTQTFAMLCLTVFLAYAYMAMLTPTIPLYVKDLGGSTFVAGLVLLSFSVPSFLLRPLVGYWADAWSVFGVLIAGTLLLTIGGLLQLPEVLALLFFASIIRGVGWAGLNTGGFSLLAHLAPPARRGQASSYYNMFIAAPSTAFPALALLLIDTPHAGFSAAIFVSALFAMAATGVAITLWRRRESMIEQPPVDRGQPLELTKLLERSTLLATVLLLCVTLTIPAVISFVPLYAKEVGIGGVGWFYVASGLGIIGIQLIVGPLTDRFGRGRSLLVSYACVAIALVIIVLARNLLVLVIAGVVYSAGQGLTSASTTAIAMDRATVQRRGAAMATYSLAFQLGMGIGSVIAGGLIDTAGYETMYLFSIGIIGVGVIFALLNWQALRLQPRTLTTV